MQKKNIKHEEINMYCDTLKLLLFTNCILNNEKKNIKEVGNRVEILNKFDNKINELAINKNKSNNKFSRDKFTKGLQKSIYKRLVRSYNIDESFLIRKMMIQDIKLILKKYFDRENILLVKSKKNLDSIIIPYIYSNENDVSFTTNDPNLFNSKAILNKKPKYNIINVDKPNSNYLGKNIYYSSNLKKASFIKNNNFIIDLKSDYHNFYGIRIVSLDNNFIEEDEFSINTIYNTWSTLIYLGIDFLPL